MLSNNIIYPIFVQLCVCVCIYNARRACPPCKPEGPQAVTKGPLQPQAARGCSRKGGGEGTPTRIPDPPDCISDPPECIPEPLECIPDPPECIPDPPECIPDPPVHSRPSRGRTRPS